jgi:hypothetical protein
MLLRTLFTFAILTSATAFARLGETEIQFVDRYGAPKDSPALDNNFPLLEGAIHHIYEYEGWRIRAAFVEPNGPAVRMEYSKLLKAGVNATIQDYELQAIMTTNTPAGDLTFSTSSLVPLRRFNDSTIHVTEG